MTVSELSPTASPIVCPQCGGPKSSSALRCYPCAWPGRSPRSTARQTRLEPAPETTVRSRRQLHFRVFCFACGRATQVDIAPRRMDRCDVCGGTMLVEIGED